MLRVAIVQKIAQVNEIIIKSKRILRKSDRPVSQHQISCPTERLEKPCCVEEADRFLLHTAETLQAGDRPVQQCKACRASNDRGRNVCRPCTWLGFANVCCQLSRYMYRFTYRFRTGSCTGSCTGFVADHVPVDVPVHLPVTYQFIHTTT